MNVGILGAGALGQPFGKYVADGGADLTYIVKEKYREETERGFRLHRHRTFGGPVAEQFDNYDVLVDYDRVAEVDWDHVWLCVSSPAIRGEWLEEFLDAIGETTLVSIQPGLGDREFLEQKYPASRIVSVRVSLIAYPTPLPGEDLPEGDVAYYMPPGERI
ncbi:MAG: ketopantoate reductase family protein, partial [Bradymonadaceae bacterium]